jgi:hypothetical protein
MNKVCILLVLLTYVSHDARFRKREVNHLQSNSVEVKNEWSFTSTSPMYDVRYLFTEVVFPTDGSGQCAFPYMRGQWKLYFFNNQPDALIIQIYSVIKLYMFRASSLPIIRSFLLYIWHW